MLFNHILGIESLDKEKESINHREAVRAIIFDKNKILMVHSNKEDYKFPGGGVKRGESLEETLKREVQEETGFVVNNVINKIGVVIERKKDEFEKDSIFEMVSHYYQCEAIDKQTSQQLDDYEAALEFKPIWITIDEAIEANEKILKSPRLDKNNWLYRETLVLHSLKKVEKGGGDYMNKMIAFCGYICNECPVFIATKDGDEDKKIALAKEYSNENYLLSPVDINCHGCTMTDEKKLFRFCTECEIRLCGLEKGLKNCGHCADYPCSKLNKPFEMSIKNKETLDEIRAGLRI